MDVRTLSLWVCLAAFVLPALFFGFQKVKQDPKVKENFIRWGFLFYAEVQIKNFLHDFNESGFFLHKWFGRDHLHIETRGNFEPFCNHPHFRLLTNTQDTWTVY